MKSTWERCNKTGQNSTCCWVRKMWVLISQGNDACGWIYLVVVIEILALLYSVEMRTKLNHRLLAWVLSLLVVRKKSYIDQVIFWKAVCQWLINTIVCAWTKDNWICKMAALFPFRKVLLFWKLLLMSNIFLCWLHYCDCRRSINKVK